LIRESSSDEYNCNFVSEATRYLPAEFEYSTTKASVLKNKKRIISRCNPKSYSLELLRLNALEHSTHLILFVVDSSFKF